MIDLITFNVLLCINKKIQGVWISLGCMYCISNSLIKFSIQNVFVRHTTFDVFLRINVPGVCTFSQGLSS